jgi:TolB-like protein/cytochrome c-type biogenesis protein CcmH/NrfG
MAQSKHAQAMTAVADRASTPLRVSLFGRFQLTDADGQAIVISGKRAQAVLAILCLAPGQTFEREQLSQLLWRGRFRAQARASLRQTLLDLRKQLADVCPEPFESTRESIAIRAEAVASDLAELEAALASGAYDAACEALLAIGSQALLEGLDFGPVFADWLSAQRQQAEQRLSQELEQALRHDGIRRLDHARIRLREIWSQRDRAPAASENDIRVAVLPFATPPGDEALALFSDGLFDELITTLGQVPQLRVAGRSSSRQLDASGNNATDAATILNVTHLVEGSIRRQGQAVRVHASLVEGGDGCQSWAGSFDGNANDLFALQQTIAMAVTQELGEVLQRQISLPAYRRSTANRGAYSLYLQGRALTARAIGDGVLAKAIELLESALTIDPDFAACWTALAEAHVYTAVYTPCLDRLGQSARMAECASKAIDLDPAQGHARAMLGIHRWTENDPVGALDLAHEAYRLEPGNPDVVLRLGSFLLYIGRTREALPYIEAAVDQDPVNGRNQAMLSVARLNLGDIDGAIAAGQCMADLGMPSMWLAVATAASGDRKLAVEQYRQSRHLINKSMFPPAGSRPLGGAAMYTFWQIAARGVCSGRAMHRKMYCALLDQLHATLHDPCDTSVVQPAIWMGYADMVFKTLGAQITPANMFCLMSMWADIEPIRQIRLHPEFLPFAERIGLTAAWEKYGRPDLLPD